MAPTFDTWTPSRAWVGVSPLAIWSTIGMHLVDRDREADADVAALAAGALARRCAIEALMPTTLPLRSVSAPPLLPGLIAASVWMAG